MQLVLARVEIAVRNLEPASHAKLMTDYELPVLDVAVRELQRDLRVIENEVSQRFTDAFVSELGTVSNLRRCEPTRAQRDHATGDELGAGERDHASLHRAAAQVHGVQLASARRKDLPRRVRRARCYAVELRAARVWTGVGGVQRRATCAAG